MEYLLSEIRLLYEITFDTVCKLQCCNFINFAGWAKLKLFLSLSAIDIEHYHLYAMIKNCMWILLIQTGGIVMLS